MVDVAKLDMTTYVELLEQLGDVSLDVDAALDKLPISSAQRDDVRFSTETRKRWTGSTSIP